MPHFGRIDMTARPSQAPASVAPGASPYTWTAPTNGLLVVTGGTVSLVQYGRSGTLTALGLINGLIPVSAGDSVRITYLTTPTVTFIETRQQ